MCRGERDKQIERDRKRRGEKETGTDDERGKRRRRVRKSGGASHPWQERQQAGSPFARHPLSLVRGEGGEPRRPQHDRRPHWSTRLAWVGLRKNWRGEKSPLNSCGCGREKLESAQPASSARRYAVQISSIFFADKQSRSVTGTRVSFRSSRLQELRRAHESG